MTTPALQRVIGPAGLAAAIFNITVGAAIFVLPAVVAGDLGAAAPLAYLVCAVATALIALCTAEAGSRVAQSGGPYAYVEVAFGSYAGFLCGVLLWLGDDPSCRERLAVSLVDRFVAVDPSSYDDIRMMVDACEEAGFMELR